MKFAPTDEHREYFQEHQEIAFENVLSLEECSRIKEEIKNKITSLTQDPKSIFEKGRDLWRSSEILQKIACQRNLAEVASQLTDVRPIRMGYDQYFPASSSEFLKHPHSIKQLSSLQGIACGWILPLSASEEDSGTLTFFSPERKIDWPTLFLKPEQDYYLVVYTPIKSVYKINNRDLNSRSFMRAGYSVGDVLNDAFNPILFR